VGLFAVRFAAHRPHAQIGGAKKDQREKAVAEKKKKKKKREAREPLASTKIPTDVGERHLRGLLHVLALAASDCYDVVKDAAYLLFGYCFALSFLLLRNSKCIS
jgi:hypothetical protein